MSRMNDDDVSRAKKKQPKQNLWWHITRRFEIRKTDSRKEKIEEKKNDPLEPLMEPLMIMMMGPLYEIDKLTRGHANIILDDSI